MQISYFSDDAANEITDGEAEGRGRKKQRREREGKRWTKLGRTAPKFEERANGASWFINEKFDPVVIASDVNNLGKFEAASRGEGGEGKGRTAPTTERITDLDLIAYSAEILSVCTCCELFGNSYALYRVTLRKNTKRYQRRKTWRKRKIGIDTDRISHEKSY